MKNISKQTKAITPAPDAKTSAGPGGMAVGSLPNALKSGMESLSGFSMDDVRVHTNSSKPAQFQALAYTQGTDIHVAPGQERHLPHEAWHVVQQKQGRVKETLQTRGISANNQQHLEREADQMGNRATQSSVKNFGQNFSSRYSQSQGKPQVTQFTKRKRLTPLKQVADVEFYNNNGGVSPTNVGAENTGISFESVIGPRTGLYLGSGPDQSIMPQTMRWLDTNLTTANSWIRGHLLNDWLGGSGKKNNNLAPMSHTTNQQWNRNFEQKMKAITERIYSFYTTSTSTDHFLLIGYEAVASGSYNPALLQGVTIPNQFDGNWYYGAYDRQTGVVDYSVGGVNTAFAELDQTTQNRIGQLEGGIVTPTMQTH